jgi:Domain of unknown function (DUF6916)
MLSRRNFMTALAACTAGVGALSLPFKPLGERTRTWLRPPRIDIGDLRVESFRGLIGSDVTVHMAGRSTTRARLVDVAHLDRFGHNSPKRMRQFSLLFSVPGHMPLADGLHRVEHPLAGSVDLYLNAVGPTGRTRQYEAVVSKLV